jgi:hypothetical protein
MSWSRSIEAKRAALAALAFCLLALPARAEDATACRDFKWPLAIEKFWFAAGPAELKSGAAVGELEEGAFTVALQPTGELHFALPPETKPKSDQPLGAILAFGGVPTPGTYQVTLSEEAWIDIVQDGSYQPALDFSGAHGCPDLRKSVRFAFTQAPLVLQLSSASAASMKLAIRRLPSQ